MRKIILKLSDLTQKFIRIESTSSLLLGFSALTAISISNSKLAHFYFELIGIKIIGLSVQNWINDALMVIFFFGIGLEVKRELIAGHLSDVRQALLPVLSAVGGMIAPALIYFYFNHDLKSAHGWAIPTATDIAFALGALSVFSKRLPFALKIFLLTLAVVDDIGAVILISGIYTQSLDFISLAVAILAIGGIVLLKFLKITSYLAYVPLGIILWMSVFKSGIHPSIAGVAMGLLTPYKIEANKESENESFPINFLLSKLHFVISFIIMPLFAFANAGVSIGDSSLRALTESAASLGILFGLTFGKPFGILLVSRVLVSFGIAPLPKNVNWLQLTGVSCLAGIGFTMSLFISNLSLSGVDHLASKLAIIVGSVLSTILGFIVLGISFKVKS